MIEEGDGEIRKSTDAPGRPRPMWYSSLSLKDLVCLLCADACDDDVWKEFVSRVERPICLTIIRTASRWGKPSRSLVEDLRQETYIKLFDGGCRFLRDFAIQHPEVVLGYVKKIAHNVTVDHFRHVHPVPAIDVDPVDWKPGPDLEVLLKEIDEHLKHCLTGPDPERDRRIFWLYYRQGMSTKEIASLPAIGLTAKGVGSVIERLKHCIRERILGIRSDSDDDRE